MTQSELIRASFEAIVPRAEELIESFYDRLFETAPGVRSLFPDDIHKQRSKLLQIIGLVVESAECLDEIEEPFRTMGELHIEYGARAEHYPVFRDVMLATLGEFAGDAWTPATESAWRWALDTVSGKMIAAGERIAA